MVEVVVVGGGLAGLRVAKALDAKLITNKKKFVFVPRTPEILSGRSKGVTIDIASHHKNTLFGTATKVDTKKQHVVVGKRKISYDYLVVATGAQAAAPVPGVRTYAKFFYTYEDAKAIAKLLPRKHVVIVGAGPTGVEVAAEIAPKSPVTIIQGTDTILPTFKEKTRAYALDCLEDKDVKVLTNKRVQRITASGVYTQDEKISADLIIWAAGVKANLLDGLPAERGHLVDDCLRVKGLQNVFAIGDCAFSGSPLTAQAAIEEANTVVANIKRSIAGNSLKKFKYKHKGSFLILGDEGAYMESFIDLRGFPARWVRELYYNWQFRSYM